MSSNQTPVYGLNQWSLDDGVIMEEFNTDNRNIEQALVSLAAAMPKIATGSYVGTGASGKDNPNTLEFDFQPKFIAIVTNEESVRPNGSSGGLAPWFFVRPWTSTNRFYTGNTGANSFSTKVTWLENGVSWCAMTGASEPTPSTPANQLNEEGKTYYYFAIG